MGDERIDKLKDLMCHGHGILVPQGQSDAKRNSQALSDSTRASSSNLEKVTFFKPDPLPKWFDPVLAKRGQDLWYLFHLDKCEPNIFLMFDFCEGWNMFCR